MAKLQLRLRFKKKSAMKPEIIFSRIEKKFDLPESQCTGWVSNKHAMLKIPEEHRTYWSPQLNIEIEQEGEGSLIRGLYGPNPTVWTMFVFFYSFITFIGIGGLMYGLTQVTLKHTPWAFWIVPAAGILLLGVYIIARVGQKMGDNQVTILQTFLDEILVN